VSLGLCVRADRDTLPNDFVCELNVGDAGLAVWHASSEPIVCLFEVEQLNQKQSNCIFEPKDALPVPSEGTDNRLYSFIVNPTSPSATQTERLVRAVWRNLGADARIQLRYVITQARNVPMDFRGMANLLAQKGRTIGINV